MAGRECFQVVRARVRSGLFPEVELQSQFQGKALAKYSRARRVAGTMIGKRPRGRNVVADAFPVDFIGVVFHGDTRG